jgi:hypothetical protein
MAFDPAQFLANPSNRDIPEGIDDATRNQLVALMLAQQEQQQQAPPYQAPMQQPAPMPPYQAPPLPPTGPGTSLNYGSAPPPQPPPPPQMNPLQQALQNFGQMPSYFQRLYGPTYGGRGGMQNFIQDYGGGDAGGGVDSFGGGGGTPTGGGDPSQGGTQQGGNQQGGNQQGGNQQGGNQQGGTQQNDPNGPVVGGPINDTTFGAAANTVGLNNAGNTIQSTQTGIVDQTGLGVFAPGDIPSQGNVTPPGLGGPFSNPGFAPNYSAPEVPGLSPYSAYNMANPEQQNNLYGDPFGPYGGPQSPLDSPFFGNDPAQPDLTGVAPYGPDLSALGDPYGAFASGDPGGWGEGGVSTSDPGSDPEGSATASADDPDDAADDDDDDGDDE